MNGWMIGGLLVMLFTFGCVSEPATPDGSVMDKADDGSMMEKDAMTKDETMTDTGTGDTMMEDGSEAMMKGVEYVPFTQEAYDQAKSEGKTIFLEFYANWCPSCKAQAPHLEAGIPMIKSDKLVAFRVNYKDTDTDANEEALAKKFNITYQHTHVVVDASETILLKSQENWSTEDVENKLGAFG